MTRADTGRDRIAEAQEPFLDRICDLRATTFSVLNSPGAPTTKLNLLRQHHRRNSSYLPRPVSRAEEWNMRLFTTVLLGMFVAVPSYSQTVINLNGGNTLQPMRLGADRAQTISITFQLSMPLSPPASTEDMTKTMAGTSQPLYDIVNHECQVLIASLGGTCRLVQLNIGGNLNNRMINGTSFVSANANAVYEIDAKAPPPPPAPK